MVDQTLCPPANPRKPGEPLNWLPAKRSGASTEECILKQRWHRPTNNNASVAAANLLFASNTDGAVGGDCRATDLVKGDISDLVTCRYGLKEILNSLRIRTAN